MRIGLNSPQALVALLVRRRWWIITPFVALSCLVVVLSKSLPKMFISESMIQVQPRDVSANFVPDLFTTTAADRVKQIEQSVMSRSNFLAIIEEFGARMPEMRNLNIDEKVDKLRNQIQIKYPSNPARPNQQLPITYFRIAASNQNPDLAQEIARKMTRLFMDGDNKAREETVDGTRVFLTAELTRVSDDLRIAQERIQKIKGSHLGELPEHLDNNQRMLENATQQVANNEDAIIRIQAQILNQEQLMLATPKTVTKILPMGPNAGAGANNSGSGPARAPVEEAEVIAYRKAKLAYEDEASRHGEGFPDVITAKKSMDRAWEKLTPDQQETAGRPPQTPTVLPVLPALASTATPSPTVPAVVDPNPAYLNLESSHNASQAELKTLMNRRKDLADRIAMFQRRIENTPQVESEMSAILRDRDSLQRQHDELKNSLAKTVLTANLESQQKGQKFSIVDEANRPVDSVTPRRIVIVAGGGAASLFFSLVFGVIVDIARQRVWTQKEIETFWGVPVLVDIPEILTDTDLALARKKKWRFAAYAVGAAMVYAVCLYGVNLKHAFILRQLDPVLQKIIN